MFNSRLNSLIRKEFIQILRDPRTLVLVLILPIMQFSCWGMPRRTMCATCRWRCSTRTGVRQPAGCWMPTGPRTISAWPMMSVPKPSCAT